MRHTILIILTFLFATLASAKCAINGIYCITKSLTLNKNGLIILEFYGSSQSLVSNLNKKYPIYLKSSNGKVQLNIIETLIGEMQLTQIILKPTSELIEEETFTLQIDNLPKYERNPVRVNRDLNRQELLSFKITNIADSDIPVLSSTPKEQKKSFISYGCGPAKWVYYNIEGKDKSELFARTSVKNKITGKITTYILPVENALVKIGHGMCSGAFIFDNGDNFEVTFQLLDQSGNKSISTNSISFTKPTISNNNE